MSEITPPARVAPFAVALAADVTPARHDIDSEMGTGRFILLHDPAAPDAWGGTFRVVCFAQAPLETEIGVDPFVADVAGGTGTRRRREGESGFDGEMRG